MTWGGICIAALALLMVSVIVGVAQAEDRLRRLEHHTGIDQGCPSKGNCTLRRGHVGPHEGPGPDRRIWT